MLINDIETTSPIITNIFNLLFKLGHIPQSWKTSFITPIPKKGRLADVENYRGISLQSVIPKLLDKLIADKLTKHTDNLLPDEQHGFRKARGTTTNLFETVLFIHDHLDENIQVDAIYLDLSRAFDTINHRVIAQRLACLSIPRSFYNLIMDFVLNRSYTLKVDGRITNHCFSTESAVPQGSHVGPVLFNLVTIPISTTVANTSSKIFTFADDSKFLKPIKSENDVVSLQTAIDNFVAWTRDNFFTVNPEKCVHVSFVKNEARRINSRYYIGSTRIPEKKEVTDLGVTFDSRLNFKAHINGIYARSMNMSFMAGRFSNEAHSPILCGKITKTYISPIIEYCAPVWQHAKATHHRKLEDILRRSTRITLNLPHRPNNIRYKPYEARLKQLNLITNAERRTINSIVFIAKILKGETISKLKDEIDFMRHIPVRTTRNPPVFDLFRSRRSKSSPLLGILSQINQMAQHFDINESIGTIKRKLKIHYRDQRDRNF